MVLGREPPSPLMSRAHEALPILHHHLTPRKAALAAGSGDINQWLVIPIPQTEGT